MCALLELDIGIMTTCMPGMKLFVTWMRGSQAVPLVVEEDTIGGGAGIRRKEFAGWGSEMESVDNTEKTVVKIEVGEDGRIM